MGNATERCSAQWWWHPDLVGLVFCLVEVLLVPMAAITVVSPAVSSACAPGETAAATTCAPFCLPGLVWDYQHTGLCLPAAPQPPPPAPFNATP